VISLASQGALLGLSAAAQPGPFQAYLLARSIRAGARRTLPLVLAPLLSDPPVIATVLLVLTRVPPWVLRGLHLLGGAIVAWLGAVALRDALGGAPVRATGEGHEARGLWRATLVNLTNPNAWIAWSVISGPILVSAWRKAPSHAVAFAVAFYAFMVGGNAVLVVVAARAAAAGPRLARALGIVSGVALVAFGVWQIVLGVAGA